jgi:hypothetical protein
LALRQAGRLEPHDEGVALISVALISVAPALELERGGA